MASQRDQLMASVIPSLDSRGKGHLDLIEVREVSCVHASGAVCEARLGRPPAPTCSSLPAAVEQALPTWAALPEASAAGAEVRDSSMPVLAPAPDFTPATGRRGGSSQQLREMKQFSQKKVCSSPPKIRVLTRDPAFRFTRADTFSTNCPVVGARQRPSSAHPSAPPMPSLPTKTERLANAMSARLAAKSGLLPTPQQWSKWHANVKTPERANGRPLTVTITSGDQKQRLSVLFERILIAECAPAGDLGASCIHAPVKQPWLLEWFHDDVLHQELPPLA
eukprot:1158943-Pelagomonas_calceolata.AAC.4